MLRVDAVRLHVGLRLRLLMWQPVPAGRDSCEDHGRRTGRSRRRRLMFHLAGIAGSYAEQDLTRKTKSAAEPVQKARAEKAARDEALAVIEAVEW